MFFILSKILAFIISPINWMVALFLFSLITKNAKRKARSFVIGVCLLLFFSNVFICDEAMRCWEISATKYQDIKHCETAIVLGGMISYDGELDRLQFSRGSDRLFQAIELYKRGYIKRIFFTGGSGSLAFKDSKEGIFVKRYLLELGISEQDFIIESESKNTRENAVNTKQIIDSLGIKGPFLLVTSGFHMRRSIGCFKKVGVEVIPYSTDRYTGESRMLALDHIFIPSHHALEIWDLLLHELLGYTVYKMTGYL